MKKLILIDGNSLINRAFYATPLTLNDGKGTCTNAVYGFINMLFKIIKDKKPTHLAVAFDLKAPTFRHVMYQEYKGTRKPMPEEMRPQFPIIKDILEKMNIAIYEKEGYEADDILGTLAKKSIMPVEVLTGDNDYLQLIDENILISITKKGISELESYTVQYLKEKMNLEPYQIIELKSLMGDSSDNIPGIKGVGEKTALKLLYEFENLDGVYANIDSQKGKLKEKLETEKEMAYLSLKLATIEIDAKIEYDFGDMAFSYPFSSEVFKTLESLKLKSLIQRKEFFENGVEEIIEEIKEKVEEKIEIIKIEELSDFPKNLKMYSLYLGQNIEIYDGINVYEIVISETFLEGIEYSEAIKMLKGSLEDESTKKIVYDMKNMKKHLDKYEVDLKGEIEDIMLMQYVVEYIPSIKNIDDMVIHHETKRENMSYSIYKTYEILNKNIEEETQKNLYKNMELPLADVLYEMEENGFKVDTVKIQELKEEYSKILSELEVEIYELVGQKFNINSPKQLQKILFEDLLLTPGKKTKTGKSTGAEVLEEIQESHAVVPKILKYRKYQKLMSTYIEGLKNQIEKEDKIHTIFNQALTSTGRLSSKEPNLQNIPVRTEEGKVLRSIFISRFDDGQVISADYSQIELRLLAHFADDETLIEAFKNKKDVHRETAGKMLGIKYEDVTSKERSMAKAVNFGIIYGISSFGLSKQLGIKPHEAGDFIKKYFEQYSKVKAYMDKNIEIAKEKGYSTTFTGRKRVIPELKSSNFNVKSFGERAAMNMPLQGGAADIIKIAMIKVASRLKEENLEAKLILQVHDELIIDAPENEIEIVKSILKKEMEDFNFKVPLEVDISNGKNWKEAK